MHAPGVRLLIADRRPIAASGLAAALADAVNLVVDACCHELPALSSVLARSATIEAVVIDIEMFDGDALQAVEAVHALKPAVAVLLLTTRVDERLLEALGHERVSCISAYSDVRAIEPALRALLRGETHLPPEVQRALMTRLRPAPPRPDRPLTLREAQVLELAATGLTISEIAATLHVSHSTAKTHLLRVYEKLEAPNRSAAVAIAIARGLLRGSIAAA